jgi:hypothetical protein
MIETFADLRSPATSEFLDANHTSEPMSLVARRAKIE